MFSPQNTVFEELVNDVSKQLELEPAMGVSNPNDLEGILIDKNPVVGIEFHHPSVSLQLYIL